MTDFRNALIVGAGSGLSAALAHHFSDSGIAVSLAARDPEKLAELCAQTGARAYGCDATSDDSVAALFAALDDDNRSPDLMVFNVGGAVRGPITDLAPVDVKATVLGNGYAAFLVAQQAAKRMLAAGKGAMLFTGASASIKGYARSSPFAIGKFGLRGLCQSLARELAPQGIHVAHFVIDGMIRSPDRGAPYDDPARTLDPDAIARTYLTIARQDPSAWTWEVELRPASEKF